MMDAPEIVLTIAGSDSGGAAGAGADLRTLAALGVYGMSVITAVTAQNSREVTAVHPLPAAFVAAQMDAVLSDYGATAVKTGFLGRVDLIETVADRLRAYPIRHIIVDPVLVNHKGASMFPPAVAQAYIDHLLPPATLITPNRQEAALLTGAAVRCLKDGETAVRRLHELGPQSVLLKRIPAGKRYVDVWFDGRETRQFSAVKIPTENTHGAGDTLSAAAAAYLARGEGMETAVARAHQFTIRAIQKGADWRLGGGHGPVVQWDSPTI